MVKKCPYCGGKASLIEDEFDGTQVFYVICEECHAITGILEDKEKVIKLWNNRVEELLPCPFCGGKALLCETEADEGTYYTVTCEDCGNSGPSSKSEAEAKTFWNKRE